MLIDFHAHILPGMDHGCKDIEMSKAQMNMAIDHKVDMIIATSHFYPHMENANEFLRRRDIAYAKIAEVREDKYPIIKLGAEVLICNRIDKMEGIEELCIENSNVLLLEMPLKKIWEPSLIETAIRLKEEKGLEVIVAHGERYNPKEMDKLLDKGFLIQVNVSAMVSLVPSKFIKKCIEQHLVVALGSDIHGIDKNSYRDFEKVMKKWGFKAWEIMDKTYKLMME